MTPGLGSISNSVNNCVSSVESIISVSTSSLRLLCFHSVQFDEVLRHDLIDGTGGVRRALTDCITFQFFLEKLHCFKAYFSPNLGKLASARVFFYLLKALPDEQRNSIHYFAIRWHS